MTADLKKVLGDTLSDIMKVRDDLGLAKAKVSLVTRTWSGKRPGEGKSSDSKIDLHPSPTIIDYSQNLRIVEAGAIRQGDLRLKHVSRSQFTKDQLLNHTEKPSIESFWEVNGQLFKAVNVVDALFYWSVQIRPETSGG